MSEMQEKYIKSFKKQKYKVLFFRIMLFVIFIGAWEVSTRFKWIDSFIFSSPSRVLITFINMCKNGQIFLHVGITLIETLVSFSLVIIIGLGMAILLWMCELFSKTIEPYLVMLNSLPKSALAPILIVWLGSNTRTIIVTAVSVAVFGTIISIYTSFKGVDTEKIKLIYTLGGNRKDILIKLILPSSLPMIISTMKVNIGLSLVGVIIGEFLAAKAGLGYLIIYGSQVFKLDWVIMSIVILCIIAIGLYSIINRIEKVYTKKISG